MVPSWRHDGNNNDFLTVSNILGRMETSPRYRALNLDSGVSRMGLLGFLVSPERRSLEVANVLDALAFKVCRAIKFQNGIMTIPGLADVMPHRWAAMVSVCVEVT